MSGGLADVTDDGRSAVEELIITTFVVNRLHVLRTSLVGINTTRLVTSSSNHLDGPTKRVYSVQLTTEKISMMSKS